MPIGIFHACPALLTGNGFPKNGDSLTALGVFWQGSVREDIYKMGFEKKCITYSENRKTYPSFSFQ